MGGAASSSAAARKRREEKSRPREPAPHSAPAAAEGKQPLSQGRSAFHAPSITTIATSSPPPLVAVSAPSDGPVQAAAVPSSEEKGVAPQLARLRSQSSILEPNVRISDFYDLSDHVLGQGITGEVRLCTNKRSGRSYACKVVRKAGVTEELSRKFRDEINILAHLHHPNIIRLRDVFEDDEFVYIVMELCSGGELFDRILEERAFTEDYVRSIVRKLFGAIAYMHSQGIIHRDLKPENIMFTNYDKDADVKIADFGFATRLLQKGRKHMRTRTPLGTLGYAAPEVIRGTGYTEKADVWSLGIMTHIMLSGTPPFCDLHDEEEPPAHDTTPFWVYVNRMRIDSDDSKLVLTFPESRWRGVSELAMSFLEFVLVPDPLQRPRSRDVLEHDWLRSHAVLGSAHMSDTLKSVKQLTLDLRKDDSEVIRRRATDKALRIRRWSHDNIIMSEESESSDYERSGTRKGHDDDANARGKGTAPPGAEAGASADSASSDPAPTSSQRREDADGAATTAPAATTAVRDPRISPRDRKLVQSFGRRDSIEGERKEGRHQRISSVSGTHVTISGRQGKKGPTKVGPGAVDVGHKRSTSSPHPTPPKTLGPRRE